nr:restriction endonuclease fold toxin 5 domain-containing protein [Burkholderia gladioli]
MAGLAVPVIEGAATALGPILARAGAAILGGAAAGAVGSLSGDTKKEDSKAAPVARTLPRTDESCKKCPPEGGAFMRANHHMTRAAREYQGRITGWPYSVEEGWSREWDWQGTDFDGFIPAQCMLQEAKGNYDQFTEMEWAQESFKGFRTMETTIMRQGRIVRANPPTKLMWYFQGPKTRAKMLILLRRWGIQSVVVP